MAKSTTVSKISKHAKATRGKNEKWVTAIKRSSKELKRKGRI